MEWQERIRNLWVERMVWIRHYIISLMMGLRDLSFVAMRALRNGTEFAELFSYFYNQQAVSLFENIMTQHILLLSELATTVKMENNIDMLQPRWAENANQFLNWLLNQNPHWAKDIWEPIIYDQFQLEVELLHQLKGNRYAEGIAQFDRAHANALRIAREMIEGLHRQFF